MHRFVHRLLRSFVSVRRRELPLLGWSFAWFFCVLSAYYVIRPVRETMGTIVGVEHLNRLFLAVFLVMLAAAPIFSFLVSRLPRRLLVPLVVRFFAAWLIGFSWANWSRDQPSWWTASILFVWVSVFNLFLVSLFWSVLADIFDKQQGKRLFGLIAAGGSLGALLSSLTVGALAPFLGLPLLLLIPVAILEVALFCFRQVDSLSKSQAFDSRGGVRPPAAATGGSVWDGMRAVFCSPYLFGICLFLLLAKFCATGVYLQQISIVSAQVESIDQRTQLFAWENSAVQVLTMICQVFLTGRLLHWLGLPATLSALPLALAVGLVSLVLLPVLPIAFAVQIINRSLAYGVTEPARQILFTVVSRTDKYKAKSFIDTVVFRGGDVAAAQLRKSVGAAITGPLGAAFVLIPTALAWAVAGWKLGSHAEHMRRKETAGDGRLSTVDRRP